MKKEFKKGLIIAVIIVVFISIADILAAHSGVFGSYEDYTAGNFNAGWWNLFYNYNVIVIFLATLFYYFFVRKDISESLGIFLTAYSLWFWGMADALYFLLQGKMIPETLVWLNGHPIMGRIANTLGSTDVTRLSLLISIALSLVVVYFMDKFLEKQKW
jgi:hypothetical protein